MCQADITVSLLLLMLLLLILYSWQSVLLLYQPLAGVCVCRSMKPSSFLPPRPILGRVVCSSALILPTRKVSSLLLHHAVANAFGRVPCWKCVCVCVSRFISNISVNVFVCVCVCVFALKCIKYEIECGWRSIGLGWDFVGKGREFIEFYPIPLMRLVRHPAGRRRL